MYHCGVKLPLGIGDPYPWVRNRNLPVYSFLAYTKLEMIVFVVIDVIVVVVISIVLDVFLDASSHLCRRVCLSVRQSVCPLRFL